MTSAVPYPWLGAVVPACPLVSLCGPWGPCLHGPWRPCPPAMAECCRVPAEAPGLLRAHAHPAGCKLPKAFSGSPQGREGCRAQGSGLCLSSLPSCGVGNAVATANPRPDPRLCVAGEAGGWIQCLCISVVSFGKCHCSSACLAGEGAEDGASAPCPHPRAAEGFVRWVLCPGPAQQAAGGTGRMGTGCQPSVSVPCLPSPLPRQAGGFGRHSCGVGLPENPWGEGMGTGCVTQRTGAVGAVPCAWLHPSPLARLASRCCSGYSAHPGWTLPGCQHTPGWGQHCPCLP